MNSKMSRIIIGVAILIVLLVVIWFGYHYWQNRPQPIDQAARAAGQKLATQGRDGVMPCIGCHGVQGEGVFAAGFPRLAGLHAEYIVKQLADYARDPVNTRAHIEPIARDYQRTPGVYEDLTVYSPGIRKDALMNGIAINLTAEERQQLGLYFSLLPFTATPVPTDLQTLERGADIALRGKPEYRLPRCTACHGPNGEGFGEHFPPLAGQPEQYLIQQINRWQTGERDNDHLSMMKNIANQLTDADKINVAKYFANKSYQVNVD